MKLVHQNQYNTLLHLYPLLSNYFEKGYQDAILNISMETQHSILFISNY